MLHFLSRLAAAVAPGLGKVAPPRLLGPWLGLVVAAVVVPWVLYPLSGIGSAADALAPAALWKVLWPLLAGAALALGLRSFGDRLLRVPNGDVAALGGAVSSAAAAAGAVCERADGWVRRWPVAGACLVLAAVAVAAAMLAGR
jgi:hypothetical protein